MNISDIATFIILYLIASSVIGATVAGLIASDRTVLLITPLAVGIAVLLIWPAIIALAVLSVPVLFGVWVGRKFA